MLTIHRPVSSVNAAKDDRTAAAEVTAALQRTMDDDPTAASELFRFFYGELRARAARLLSDQPLDHTLQATALVNEVYLKLMKGSGPPPTDSRHFIAVATKAMRHILVDHARRRSTRQQSRKRHLPTLEDVPASMIPREEVLAVNDALMKYATRHARAARVVELRFFGGLKVHEIARALDVSKRAVEYDLASAQAWLSRRLSEGDE